MTDSAGYSVVVFARNEVATPPACLEAIARDLATALLGAGGGTANSSLCVVLNGCDDGSRDVLLRFARTSPLAVNGLEIDFPDKSNAWNQYIHVLAPPAGAHVFVDGYATLAPGSIAALADALARKPRANAATGLPSVGRSATRQRQSLLRNGGLHGSLHALPGHFVARIRAAGLRLPVGLYRGDGLIGSFAMHDLDPANAWDTSRVVAVADATWGLPRFNLAQVPKHLRRRVNQARGRLESAAIKEIIYGHTPRNGYAALPTHADAMLLQYLDTHPLARPHWHDLAGRLAVRQLSRPREPSAAQAGCQALLPGEVNPE